jgi:hypothetical protein
MNLNMTPSYSRLLVCADHVNFNLLDENISIIKKSTKALLYASKEVSLEVNTEKTVFLSPDYRRESLYYI